MNHPCVGIAGLGQIGGSIAARLSRSESYGSISGYDLKPDLLATAHARGYLDNAATSISELIDSVDIVVIALPMGEIFAAMKSYHERLASKQLVIDTGSLKAQVVTIAEELGLSNFVGGHPLAGTEKRGSDAWNENLFVNENYFLTATMHTTPESYRRARQFVDALGARIVEVGAGQHDEIFATTSNIPHLFAFLLQRKFEALSAGDDKAGRFVCPSFYGATRVAKSDPEMVFQMLWHNRARLGATLDELIRQLKECRDDLSANDENAFRGYFRRNTHEERHD